MDQRPQQKKKIKLLTEKLKDLETKMRQIARNRLLSGFGTISSLSLSLSLSLKKKKKKDDKEHKDLLSRSTIMSSKADQASLTYILKKG